jgi:hypothetical protein
VGLSVQSIDRIYVNGYVPRLQTSGQLVYFLTEHRGNKIASPALLGQMGERYRELIRRFVVKEQLEVVQFSRGERKDDIAGVRRERFGESEGVVFVGVAQERASSFRGVKLKNSPLGVSFDFPRCSVFVNHYYFYVEDLDWGPAFFKIGSYVPYPVKLCLNGHEWAKQQLRRAGIPFQSLDNGFLTCDDPKRLQELCDQLGPQHIQSFFDRWQKCLPWPLLDSDQEAGFRHRLSIWQLELSLTQVFEQPRYGRLFFDQVIRGNLDLGRPDRLRLLFPKRFVTQRTPPPRFGYRTRVLTAGVNPSLHFDYKQCAVKQYFKEGRALRTETTINEPGDFAIKKSLPNLWQLKTLGQSVNQRLLQAETLAETSTLAAPELETLQRPIRLQDGQRGCALRFGDLRVMALFAALCHFSLQVRGFRNRELRSLVASLLGHPYSPNQMTYDLRRLRHRAVIQRLDGQNRYVVTPLGLRLAFLYSKLSQRLLTPAWAALIPAVNAPLTVRRALHTLDSHLDQICDLASLTAAA